MSQWSREHHLLLDTSAHILVDSAPTSRSPSNNGETQCLLIGVPSEYSLETLLEFVGAYSEHILDTNMFPSVGTDYQTALLTFTSPESMRSFVTLYAYQHYPLLDSFDQICLVLPMRSVIQVSNMEDYLAQSIGLVEIPQCPYCLGRIDESVTGVRDSQNALPQIINESTRARCMVCEKLYAHLSGKEVGCTTCGLLGNIWVCLLCSNGGCGYYSRQHAKDHFETSGHALCIELATGRVWDYAGDRFVQCSSSDAMWEIAWSAGSAGYSAFEDVRSKEGVEDEQLLDPIIQAKIMNLDVEYENLINAQLRDQELHYDKITMQETLAGLSLSLSECEGRGDGVEVEEMRAIHDLKVEISRIEQDLGAVMADAREGEKGLREMQKENDFLIREQKRLRDETASIQHRARDLAASNEALAEDLQNQVKDLRFFARSKQTLEQSDVSGEMKDSNLIIVNNESAASSSAIKDPKRRNSKSKSKR